MQKKVNIKTIANDLNLSVSTISRILNNKGREFRISDETAKLVSDYAKKVGYSPNMVAKGLQSSRTFTLGLIIPDIANPFFSLMAMHIEKAASKQGYTIILAGADEQIEQEKRQLNNLANRNVDGIIAAPVGTSFDHYSEITNNNIPLVFIDRYSNKQNIPYIASDNYKGGFEATTHLINCGHTRIGLIMGEGIVEPVIERKKGYIDAHKAASVKVNRLFICGTGFSIENGYNSTLGLLSLATPPTAILAMSNLIGLGVLKALQEKNLHIPNDLSLIIYDDQPYVSFINPPVTTVKQSSEIIGKRAVDYLLGLINNSEINQPSGYVPVQLVVRKSVKHLR